jgi:hypothetical protein
MFWDIVNAKMNKSSPWNCTRVIGKIDKEWANEFHVQKEFGDLYYWWKQNKELLNLTTKHRNFEHQNLETAQW